MFENLKKYICCYEIDDELKAIIMKAPDKDTAKFFTALKSMEDSESYFPGKVVDISEYDPLQLVSLTIHQKSR